MKNNIYSREKYKKKTVLIVLCIATGLLWSSYGKQDDLFRVLTKYFVPIITYENEYGCSSAMYEGEYQIPDWFSEDEDCIVADDEMNQRLVEDDSASEQQTVVSSMATNQSVTYSMEQLSNSEFLLSKIFVVDSNTSMTADELSIENLLQKDLSIDGLKNEMAPAETVVENGKKDYKILIYHTHGSESFVDSRPGVVDDTVIGVGRYLAQILEEQYGVSVYHDETVYDVVDGVLDRNKAYENAYQSVSHILEDNPSIEVVIDLHRDGVSDDVHLVTNVNNKPTAKIMFLNGVSRSNLNGEIAYLENPNKLSNLAFSFQMFLKGKELYGDYVRKIYVKSLRFNLHVKPRATLIEVGAQNNTLEEEKNAMEPLAEILYQVLSKKE